MKTPESYVGKWRITHMDEWDQDFVDLAAPGYVKIQRDGSGSFQFGAVQGEMDCRVEKTAGSAILGFSWDGSDECDRATGRGWVRVNGKQMEGHIFFHLGDDSGFTAEKIK
jgi:hypothetical protein